MRFLSEITKKKLSSPINYKILGIIAILTILYQISLYQVDPEEFNVPEIIYLSGILVSAGFSFMVAKRYKGSVVFSKAYLFLGLAFIGWFIGDFGYVYYDHVLEQDPYPNPFDVGFAASYVFSALHLVLNTRHFAPKWNYGMKILLVVIPIATIFAYSVSAAAEWGDYEELSFDIFYGNIFAGGASSVLALAILGAIVFRHSILKEVWLLLVIGIFIWTIADVWYAFAEVFESFDNTHPTNTLWMLTFMIVTYALYKHRKVL